MGDTVQIVDVGRINGECFAYVGDEKLPVTHMFDCDGDDCEFEDAVVVVAGPDREGYWITIELDPGMDMVH